MVAVALLLVVVQMVALGVIGAAGDDTHRAALVIESARARMNAESASAVVAREWLDTPALPASATITLPDGSAVVVTAFSASPAAPGTARVRGLSGTARREIDAVAP